MKRALLILAILGLETTISIQAQDLKISFSATGSGIVIDSVKVENLTKGISTTCSGRDTLHLMSNVGVPEISTHTANGISIYPNPMNGVCSFEFSTSLPGMATIYLCNISGQVLLREQAFLPAGSHTGRLGGLAGGTYFIKMVSGNYSSTAKILSIGNNPGQATIHHIYTTGSTDQSVVDSQRQKSGVTKNISSDIDFPFTLGDRLKLTGQSGIYRTIVMLVPRETETIGFNFIECTDADSNNYTVVRIGSQWWMAENLKTAKYRNGDIIPNVTNNTDWGNLVTGAMAWYNHNPVANKDIYGGLYNWYAVNDTRNIAPPGWHVATDADWTALTTYLGATSTSGGKVKEPGYAHWKTPNSGATNETGFTALPGGYRFLDGTFDELLGWSVWWCSTSSTVNLAPTRAVFYNYNSLGRDLSDKKDGFAIRCIKNQ